MTSKEICKTVLNQQKVKIFFMNYKNEDTEKDIVDMLSTRRLGQKLHINSLQYLCKHTIEQIK